MNSAQQKVPERIEQRIAAQEDEVQRILDCGRAELKVNIEGRISFQFTSSAPREVLTDFERAQSVCFIAKYDSLPKIEKLKIIENDGKYHLGNLDFIRHALNEFRPFIMNQKDSIYYHKLQAFCHPKLNADPTEGISITVDHENLGDITESFKISLGERVSAVRRILEESDFDYVFNGILQHSDHKFTDRFWKEYATGELNYVFIKHSGLLQPIKDLLFWHYQLFKVLTFPKLGPL